MSQKIDLQNAIIGAKDVSNFHFYLFKLILKADKHNLALLRKGFPNAVKLVGNYRITGVIDYLPYD